MLNKILTQKTLFISLASLIIANLTPVIGTIFWNWNIGQIILAYWLENVIIGFFNILRMLAIQTPKKFNQANNASKLFFIPFFTIHYGIFCLVHGVFIFVFFVNSMFTTQPSANPISIFSSTLTLILSLFVSHAISYFVNYIGNKEYKKTNLPTLMFKPYGRIVVVHLTILFGVFITLVLGNQLPVLLLLVILKTIVDSGAHIKEHSNF